MKRFLALFLWLAIIVAAASTSYGFAGFGGSIVSPGVINLGNVNFVEPSIRITFNYPDSVASSYHQARDTFMVVSDTNNLSSFDMAGKNSTPDQFWTDPRFYGYREFFGGNIYTANLYPMSGYNHFHLGFADPTVGNLSVHDPNIDPFPDGFGCFCDPHSPAENAAGGPFYGFGSVFFPSFWDFSPLAIAAKSRNQGVCNWNGAWRNQYGFGGFAWSPGYTPDRAPCPNWSYGRYGIYPHSGDEFMLFYIDNRSPGQTYGVHPTRFALESITTGGGDMEVWLSDPSNNNGFWFFGPIAPNTTWTSYSPIIGGTELWIRDYQGGFDSNWNPAPRSILTAVQFHIAPS